MPSKLLIADDSTTIQKVFERTFPPEEFAITFANNGDEALAKAREDKPDLVIADINMPLKNGFEVCEEVKNDPNLKGTPVLLLIGILDDFDEDESRRVRADGFIVKPFEANAAISKVRETLALGEGAPPMEKAVEEIPPLREVVEEAMEEAVQETVEEAVPREEAVEEAIPREEAVEEIVPREEAVKEEEEEVLELEEVVEEPAAAAPPPGEEKKEEEFVLETPLRDLEVELREEFPEEKVEEKEEPLTLDLPMEEMEPEPVTRRAEAPDLFEELEVEEAKEGIRPEKMEAILDESAAELERIEGLAPKKEEKLEGVIKEAMEGLAERLAAALSHELREIVEEALKETVPKLVRQEMEKPKEG